MVLIPYLSKDGTVALTRFSVSKDGKLLAYATSERQRLAEGHIRRRYRREFNETINWCRFTTCPGP